MIRRLWLPILLLAVGGCQPEEPVFYTRFLAFGTLMDLTIVGVSPDRAEQAAQALEADFLRMHKSWHAWDPGPLGRVNRQLETGERFSAPPSVLPLIKLGQSLSVTSNALFNPAIGHLIDLWGFHRDDPDGSRPPPEAEIEALVKKSPAMSDIEIDGLYIHSSNSAVKLDFGAFGKGYGIDLAVAHLRELDISNAIVNAGGDLRAIGSRNGVPWRIAVRHPNGTGIIGTIEISDDESVFTSGDYERNFTWEEKRYHHILDPRTGFPATDTTSVTVIHSNSTTADAAATALFVAGPEEWFEIAEKMGLTQVLLIDQAGTLHMTPAMQQRLNLVTANHRIEISPPLPLATIGR